MTYSLLDARINLIRMYRTRSTEAAYIHLYLMRSLHNCGLSVVFVYVGTGVMGVVDLLAIGALPGLISILICSLLMIYFIYTCEAQRKLSVPVEKWKTKYSIVKA